MSRRDINFVLSVSFALGTVFGGFMMGVVMYFGTVTTPPYGF